VSPHTDQAQILETKPLGVSLGNSQLEALRGFNVEFNEAVFADGRACPIERVRSWVVSMTCPLVGAANLGVNNDPTGVQGGQMGSRTPPKPLGRGLTSANQLCPRGTIKRGISGVLAQHGEH
jgi:hypothetical protein